MEKENGIKNRHLPAACGQITSLPSPNQLSEFRLGSSQQHRPKRGSVYHLTEVMKYLESALPIKAVHLFDHRILQMKTIYDSSELYMTDLVFLLIGSPNL